MRSATRALTCALAAAAVLTGCAELSPATFISQATTAPGSAAASESAPTASAAARIRPESSSQFLGKAVTYEDGVIISTTKMHVITPSSGQFIDGDGQPVTPELVTMIAMQIHNGSPNPVHTGREVSATIDGRTLDEVYAPGTPVVPEQLLNPGQSTDFTAFYTGAGADFTLTYAASDEHQPVAFSQN